VSRALACLGLFLGLAGCASTKVETSGPADRPLCRADVSALVVWEPKWRPDQNDVAEREAAVQRGIERFFTDSRCFARTQIRRNDDSVLEVFADRLVAIRVRELGPAVALEIKMLDARSGRMLADLRTHWQRGGPWEIKGIGTLEDDMHAALAAVLTF
jgi:hypothetical protein